MARRECPVAHHPALFPEPNENAYAQRFQALKDRKQHTDSLCSLRCECTLQESVSVVHRPVCTAGR
eukprot:1160525-Pelagomonas_calceolata.AAC.11